MSVQGAGAGRAGSADTGRVDGVKDAEPADIDVPVEGGDLAASVRRTQRMASGQIGLGAIQGRLDDLLAAREQAAPAGEDIAGDIAALLTGEKELPKTPGTGKLLEGFAEAAKEAFKKFQEPQGAGSVPAGAPAPAAPEKPHREGALAMTLTVNGESRNIELGKAVQDRFEALSKPGGNTPAKCAEAYKELTKLPPQEFADAMLILGSFNRAQGLNSMLENLEPKLARDLAGRLATTEKLPLVDNVLQHELGTKAWTKLMEGFSALPEGDRKQFVEKFGRSDLAVKCQYEALRAARDGPAEAATKLCAALRTLRDDAKKAGDDVSWGRSADAPPTRETAEKVLGALKTGRGVREEAVKAGLIGKDDSEMAFMMRMQKSGAGE